jgi:hypothetical protein
MSRKKKTTFGASRPTSAITHHVVLKPAPVAQGVDLRAPAPKPAAPITHRVTLPAKAPTAAATLASAATDVSAAITASSGPVTGASPAVAAALPAIVPTNPMAVTAAPVAPTGSSGGGTGGGSGGNSGGGSTYEETPDPRAEAQSTQSAWSPPISAPPSTALALAPAPAPSPAAPTGSAMPAPTKGIFARIWDFFFGVKAPAPIAALPAGPTAAATKVGSELEQAAESLVKRARMGDQNAMAMIDMVRRNAPTVPAARVSYGLMKAYIEAHPVSQMGMATAEDGAMMESPTVAMSMHADPRVHGATFHRTAEYVAKKIAVRKPGSVISRFSRKIGIELGE